MVFQVPPSKASVGQDMFDFEIAGKKFKVKRAKFVPIGQLEALEESGTAALDFFGVKGTKQGDAVRALEQEQFAALVEAWRDDSEVSAGESQASVG